MASKTALRLDLTVHRLLPSPSRASVGIGLFRVACASEGGKVADTVVQIDHGSSMSLGACGTLIIRTDQPLTVTLQIAAVTSTLTVNQLLVLDNLYDEVSVAFDAVGLEGVANVTIIQA